MKNTNKMKNEKIFITGGAGFLGKRLIDRLYKNNEITVYSRDEAKHYYMKKEYPSVSFVVGDVRNKDLLIRKSRGHTIGIFAASLKQIEACDENYKEEFGLSFEITEPRTGEKIHEIMAASEEIRRMEFIKKDKIYIIHPKKHINKLKFINNEYSSRDYCLSKKELYKYLKSKNFFKP